LSQIDIRRPHDLPLAEARKLAEQMAAQLRERFELDYVWRGHALVFSRDGVEGKLVVATDEIHLQARLGFLLSFLKPAIEDEIEQTLARLYRQAHAKHPRDPA
jgi:putative polyhydroxyalkanoate system protein